MKRSVYRKFWVVCIGSFLLAVLLLEPWVQAAGPEEEIAVLQRLSRAFSHVAKRAIPAVVFIQVEKLVAVGRQPFEFNNPFDLFSEEFFERFFRRRFPEWRRQYKQMGQGSGFIISPDGYILTNNHVVGDADRITVGLADGRKFQARIVGTDPKSDVAVIKIDGENLPVLPLGDSDALEVGEWVIAIGNPFGLKHTITVGVVSAKGRSTVGITDYEDFIQTDAAINPGNSGGPLINLRGEAVGINTAIFSRSGGYMGIGFAIPINRAKVIEKQLIQTGRVVRGYLGVSIQALTPELARSFGLETTEGVLITEVTRGSPAEKAGLRPGDVILAFHGKAVKDVGQFRNLVALTPPGTRVKILLVRNRVQREITVTIGQLPEEPVGAGQIELLKRLGFAVQNLTPELAQQLGYAEGQGVLIAQVEPGGVAYMAGLRPGMLIREVNRKPVSTVDDFLAALTESLQSKTVLLLVQEGPYSRFVVLRVE
ncbi:MAG: DegQ family serine endoprotease [Nitrospinota bacterium]|nr:MAG: DegQ family serine endoprotease [Nitrospinota bacterium]